MFPFDDVIVHIHFQEPSPGNIYPKNLFMIDTNAPVLYVVIFFHGYQAIGSHNQPLSWKEFCSPENYIPRSDPNYISSIISTINDYAIGVKPNVILYEFSCSRQLNSLRQSDAYMRQ